MGDKKPSCRPNFKVEDVITTELLKGYLKEGWASITKDYKSKRHGKERTPIAPKFNKLTKSKQTLALEILGSIRKYTVKTAFECQHNAVDYNEHFAAGSSNVTSDFDASVNGPDGNKIMWQMFLYFADHYKGALPYAFDSNLYSGPLYVHTSKAGSCFEKKDCNTNIKPRSDVKLRQARKATDKNNSFSGFPRVDYKDRQFTLVPQTEDEIQEELNWAGIKLLHIKENIIDFDTTYKKLSNILKNSQKLKDYLDEKCKEKDDGFDVLTKKYTWLTATNSTDPVANERIKEAYKIFKNYYLQYKSQEKVQRYVYFNEDIDLEKIDGEDKKNVFFYSNTANYFASEAYYTSSAVNAVVIENQLKQEISFPKGFKRTKEILLKTRVVAAMEQLGDMSHHISSEFVDPKDKGSVKKIILKYSKYIYRFYFILSSECGHIHHAEYNKNKELADAINKKLIPFRKTYAVDQIDDNVWNLIDAKDVKNTQISKDNWCKKTQQKMLQMLNEILLNPNYSKKIKRSIKKRKVQRKSTKKKR